MMETALACVFFIAVCCVAGCGVLRAIGLSVSSQVDFVLLGYAGGVAGSGIAIALLTLVDGVPGRIGFAALAAAFVVVGELVRHFWGSRVFLELPHWTRLDVVTAAVAGMCLAIVGYRFSRWPLGAWDGWAIWSLKTHALYSAGGVSSPALHGAPYPHPDYPLLMPGLEATWLHYVGRYNGELLHLQLVFFLVAFAAALIVLLRMVVPQPLRGLLLLAAVLAPEMLGQLVTNYADAPVALFVSLGVLCLALWVRQCDIVCLQLAALFLAAAALTKDEGMVFVAAAFVAAALSSAARGRRREVGWAALASLTPDAVWRLHTTAAGLTDSAYNTALLHHPIALAHRVSRVPVAIEGLVSHSARWDYLLIVPAVAAVAALVRRSHIILAFALEWALLSLAGLVVVYWISVLPIHEHIDTSADRIIASLEMGLLLISAALVGDGTPAASTASAPELPRRHRL